MTAIDTARLRELLRCGTDLPWELWTSNSFRRITGPDRRDGGVLFGAVQADNQGDLTGYNVRNDLNLIIAAVNALPELLTAFENQRRLVLAQIAAERARQPDGSDDSRPQAVWAALLSDHVARAVRAGNGDDDEWRQRLVVIAALCVAAIESHDRRQGQPIESEHTEPTESGIDARCGSQGIDEDGHCSRCGLLPGEGDLCPAGFLIADTEGHGL